MLLKDAIKEYLDWKRVNTRRAAEVYEEWLENFSDFLGNVNTKKIRLDDIVKFRVNLALSHNSGGVFNHNNVIKNFFRWLKAHELTKIDPFLIGNIKAPVPDVPVANPEQVNLMYTALDKDTFNGLRSALAIKMMWTSMVRVSELVALNMSDIVSHKNHCEIISAKNYNKRWISWSDSTHKLLLKYIEQRGTRGDTALFINDLGKRVTTRTVQRWVAEARELAGIDIKLSCHSLRHGGAHELAKKGAHLKELGTRLGHSLTNPRAAMQYLRFNKEEQLAVSSKYQVE